MRNLIIIAFFSSSLLCLYHNAFSQNDTLIYFSGRNEKLKIFGGSDTISILINEDRIESAWLPNGYQTITNGNGYRQYGDSDFIRRYYYKNGIMNGPIYFYYLDGSLKAKGMSKNGEFNGLFEWYHKNGKVSYRNYYKNGKNIDQSQGYDSTGSLLSTTDYYKNGNDSLQTIFYPNGKIKSIGNWGYELTCIEKNDPSVTYISQSIKIGTWKFFYPNGQLEHSITYEGCYSISEDIGDGWGTIDYEPCPIGKSVFYDWAGKILKIVEFKNCMEIK